MNLHARIDLYLRARRARRRGDPEIALLPRLIARSRRVIDIGANRGVYTWWLSRLAREVESFEPNPRLADWLAAAAVHNVTVHQVALSDHTGTAELFVPKHHKRGLNHPAGRLGVPDESFAGTRYATRLARLDEYAFQEVDFIKIDVEGHEEAVLAGGWETLSEWRPLLLVELEERHNPGCLDRVSGRLAELGYRGRFLDLGEWHDLAVLEVGGGQRGASGRYINNFLFAVDDREDDD